MRPPDGVATLILAVDVSWSEDAAPAPAVAARLRAPVSDEMVAAAALRGGEPCVMLLGGTGVRRAGLEAASRIAETTGARMLCETSPARLERGARIPAVEQLAYFAKSAAPQVAGARHLILAGAVAPVIFFACPGSPSSLVPAGCQVHVLAEAGDDVPGALAALAELVAPDSKPAPQQPSQRDSARWRPHRPDRGGGHRRAAPRGRNRVRRSQHLQVLARRRHGGSAAA